MNTNPPPPPAKAKAGEQGNNQAKAEGGQPAVTAAKSKAEGVQPVAVTAKTKSGCLVAKATAKQPPETATANAIHQEGAPELMQDTQPTTKAPPAEPSAAAQSATKKRPRIRVLDMTPKPRKAQRRASPAAGSRWGCPDHQSPDMECQTCQNLLPSFQQFPGYARHVSAQFQVKARSGYHLWWCSSGQDSLVELHANPPEHS